MRRNVRALVERDIYLVIDYFLQASPEFLNAMGADIRKLPDRTQWYHTISDDLKQPLHKKAFFYVIWEIDSTPVGHSNINNIIFREEAYMHLHLWNTHQRQRGNGLYFIRESITHYIKMFALKKIYCEPYAHNPAPNKTLPKAGFKFVKQYETTPGRINFHQTVNRWELSVDPLKN